MSGRKDLHIVSASPEIWELVKELSSFYGESISFIVRQGIKQQYKQMQEELRDTYGNKRTKR